MILFLRDIIFSPNLIWKCAFGISLPRCRLFPFDPEAGRCFLQACKSGEDDGGGRNADLYDVNSAGAVAASKPLQLHSTLPLHPFINF